jgi:hypothetical protein
VVLKNVAVKVAGRKKIVIQAITRMTAESLDVDTAICCDVSACFALEAARRRLIAESRCAMPLYTYFPSMLAVQMLGSDIDVLFEQVPALFSTNTLRDYSIHHSIIPGLQIRMCVMQHMLHLCRMLVIYAICSSLGTISLRYFI